MKMFNKNKYKEFKADDDSIKIKFTDSKALSGTALSSNVLSFQVALIGSSSTKKLNQIIEEMDKVKKGIRYQYTARLGDSNIDFISEVIITAFNIGLSTSDTPLNKEYANLLITHLCSKNIIHEDEVEGLVVGANYSSPSTTLGS